MTLNRSSGSERAQWQYFMLSGSEQAAVEALQGCLMGQCHVRLSESWLIGLREQLGLACQTHQSVSVTLRTSEHGVAWIQQDPSLQLAIHCRPAHFTQGNKKRHEHELESLQLCSTLSLDLLSAHS